MMNRSEESQGKANGLKTLSECKFFGLLVANWISANIYLYYHMFTENLASPKNVSEHRTHILLVQWRTIVQYHVNYHTIATEKYTQWPWNAMKIWQKQKQKLFLSWNFSPPRSIGRIASCFGEFSRSWTPAPVLLLRRSHAIVTTTLRLYERFVNASLSPFFWTQTSCL